MRKFKYILYTIAIIFFAVGTYSQVYTDYLTYYPFKVLEIKNSPYPVLTPIVKAGQSVTFEASYCVYRTASTTVTQWLTSPTGQIFIITSKPITITPGCHDGPFTALIPPNIPPDTYVLHSTADYPINPFHSPFHAVSQTQSFKVTN